MLNYRDNVKIYIINAKVLQFFCTQYNETLTKKNRKKDI